MGHCRAASLPIPSIRRMSPLSLVRTRPCLPCFSFLCAQVPAPPRSVQCRVCGRGRHVPLSSPRVWMGGEVQQSGGDVSCTARPRRSGVPCVSAADRCRPHMVSGVHEEAPDPREGSHVAGQEKGEALSQHNSMLVWFSNSHNTPQVPVQVSLAAISKSKLNQ